MNKKIINRFAGSRLHNIDSGKKFKIQLISFLFLFILLIVSVLFLPDLKNVAKALSPNYSKNIGDSLSNTDWNNLPNDFVAKTGDTMTGALNLPGDPVQPMQAATMQYVDNTAGSLSMDMSGKPLKMICGSSNAWVDAPVNISYTNTIYVDISYPVGTFSSDPRIFIELGGNSQHFWTLKSVYRKPGAVNYSAGFRAYVWNGNYFNELGITTDASDAFTWGWVLNWCAIGPK